MKQTSLPVEKPAPAWKSPEYLKWRKSMELLFGRDIFKREPTWRMQ